MNSYYEKLFGRKMDTEKHRVFSDTDIPGLVDRLIGGIKGEKPTAQILEEVPTGDSSEVITMKISKKDFGDILLALKYITNQRNNLAEVKMTLDGLIRFYKDAQKKIGSADNEATGLQEVKKVFGWQHRRPVNRERIFWEYIELIMGTTTLLKIKNPKPMGKKDAIRFLKQRYDFESYDSAYEQIKLGLEGWKQAFRDREYKQLLPENPSETKNK